jgi:hypothetical protein
MESYLCYVLESDVLSAKSLSTNEQLSSYICHDWATWPLKMIIIPMVL